MIILYESFKQELISTRMEDSTHKQTLQKTFPGFQKTIGFVDSLIDAGQIIEIKSGTTIMDVGDYVKVIPFLIHGLIKIYRENDEGNELLLYYINSGESCVISITTSLKNEKSSIKALVEEDSTILAVPIQKFESLLKEYDLLHTFTYDLFNSKYNELINSIDSLAFSDMRTRLLDYLQKESTVKNSKSISGLTHKQIAMDLSTSREVISRLLNSLQKEGKITIDKKVISLM